MSPLSSLTTEAKQKHTSRDTYQSEMKNGILYISSSSSSSGLSLSMPPVPSLSASETSSEQIPETVLQYERQMRKRQAADQAGSPVTKEQHLHVLYRDEHLVVTNKPSGVLTVPGVRHNPCLLTCVHHEYAPHVQPPDRLVCHRLDMDTSGIVVFALTPPAMAGLHQAFRDRTVLEKTYQALVCGHVHFLPPHDDSNINTDDNHVPPLPIQHGIVDLPLQRDHERPPFMRISTASSEHEAAQVVHDLQHAGWKKLIHKRPKPSQTEWKILAKEYLPGTDLPVTRLQLTPLTGRTHQLRVHCAALGHPIVADPAYGIYGEASANGGFSEESMDQMSPHRASLALQKAIRDHTRQSQQSSSSSSSLSSNHDNSNEQMKMCLHAQVLSLRHPITGDLHRWEAPTPF